MWEPNLGLYNYRARFYDPLTGSFTQPDSIVPNAMDPRAWNRFGYVYGNPANFTDPSGHTPIATMAIGTVLGAVVGFGSYSLSTVLSGHEFNIEDALLATTAGAAAGLAIGSGAALIGAGLTGSGSVLIGTGTGALASEGGYLAANAITGAPFSAGDFVIATGIGAISGAITPFIPGPWIAAALGGTASVSQYAATQLNNSKQISGRDLFWSFTFGAAIGGLSTLIKPPPVPLTVGFQGRGGVYYGFSPKEVARDYSVELARFVYAQSLPRFFALAVYGSVPGILNEIFPYRGLYKDTLKLTNITRR